ncbi:hypothetical protein ACFX1X_028533 [Malus domestica]
MPYAFIDLARVTRSHISVANTPAKMDVPNRLANHLPLHKSVADPLVQRIHTLERGKPRHKVLKSLP